MIHDERIAEQAHLYAEEFGWRVVPLHGSPTPGVCSCSKNGDCPSAGKHPRVSNWQNVATNDPDAALDLFGKFKNNNLGVALGESSGIIDIECDDDEAEKILYELFDGELPLTPTFQANRGKHRLFKWSNQIPFPSKNSFKIKQLEFRTGNAQKGAQSVFPPSVHSSGLAYEWIISPFDETIAEIPEEVIAKLVAFESGGAEIFNQKNSGRSSEYWQELKSGVSEGGRNDAAASYAGQLIGTVSDPYNDQQIRVMYDALRVWNTTNKPPMDEDELQVVFNSILQRHRLNHTEQQSNNGREIPGENHPEEQYSTEPGEMYAGWKLVEYQSEPVQWRLYAPLWKKAVRGGFITLLTDEFDSVLKIRRKALEAARVLLDKSFKTLWLGGKNDSGLSEYVFRNREIMRAGADEIRTCEIASILWNRIAQLKRDAQTADEDPQPDGKICVLTNGEIWFQMSPFLNDTVWLTNPVTKKELLNLLDIVECDEKRIRINNRQMRFRVLNNDSIREIGKIANYIQNDTEHKENASVQ